MSYQKYIAHSDDFNFEENVKELLLYRKITKAEKLDEREGILTLDNGTQLIVQGNSGCGGCGNGWYDLCDLNECNNVITNVKCEIAEKNYDDIYSIFVFSEDKRIECVQYRGYDNGYYGRGYSLSVMVAETADCE